VGPGRCRKDPIIVGTVGDLEPGKPDFPQASRNASAATRSFAAIPMESLGQKFGPELLKPIFISDSKRRRGRSGIGYANPNRPSFPICAVDRRIPTSAWLCSSAQMEPPTEPAVPQAFHSNLLEIWQAPSNLRQGSEFSAVSTAESRLTGVFRQRLDQLWKSSAKKPPMSTAVTGPTAISGLLIRSVKIVRDTSPPKGRRCEKFFGDSIAA